MRRWKRELVWWLLSQVNALLAEEPLEEQGDYERQLVELKQLLHRLDLPRFEPVPPPWVIPSRPLVDSIEGGFNRMESHFLEMRSLLAQVSTGVQQAFRIEHSGTECNGGKIGAVKGLIENKELKLVCDDDPTKTEKWTVDHLLK